MTDDALKNLEKKATDAHIADTQVKDFMSKDVFCIKQGYSIKTTIEVLKNHKISGAPVTDENNKLIGVISEYDLLLQASTKDLLSPVQFNKSVTGLKLSTTLKEIIVLLHKTRFKRFPVTDDHGKVKGVVSRMDVLDFLAKNQSSK